MGGFTDIAFGRYADSPIDSVREGELVYNIK